jgi:hypothetical protein
MIVDPVCSSWCSSEAAGCTLLTAPADQTLTLPYKLNGQS